MLSKCANPVCDTKFQYLHQGRVYVVRYRAFAQQKMLSSGLEFSEELDRVEHLWLCSDCSRSMKIEAHGTGEIRVVPATENPNGFKKH
jgi:hypothetical protein